MTTDTRNPWMVLTVRCAAPGRPRLRQHSRTRQPLVRHLGRRRPLRLSAIFAAVRPA